MNRVLAQAEADLQEIIHADDRLEMELKHWKHSSFMLDHENNLHRNRELDLIPSSKEPDEEHMTGKLILSLPLS